MRGPARSAADKPTGRTSPAGVRGAGTKPRRTAKSPEEVALCVVLTLRREEIRHLHAEREDYESDFAVVLA